jgi:hypothetical protein
MNNRNEEEFRKLNNNINESVDDLIENVIENVFSEDSFLNLSNNHYLNDKLELDKSSSKQLNNSQNHNIFPHYNENPTNYSSFFPQNQANLHFNPDYPFNETMFNKNSQNNSQYNQHYRNVFLVFN